MTALEQATDPTTSARDLERLAGGRDAVVRECVAGNPNIGLATFERLSVRFAGAVLKNPLLDLLGLENANWVAELREFSRHSLLRHPSCPNAWLEAALLTEGNAALAALQNPACPVALLEQVSDPAVLELARLHVNHPAPLEGNPEGMIREAAANLERDTEALKDAAAVRMLPIWMLGVLSLSDDLELALLAARHPDSPAEALEHLAFHADPDVRGAVLGRDLPLELRFFIQRVDGPGLLEESDVQRLLPTAHGRWIIAEQGAGAALEALVTDADWRVRQVLAQNPALEPHSLATLSTDLDKDVRCAVAGHIRTPKSVLARLLLDDHEEVRAAARGNESAPLGLRASLSRLEAGDPSLSVAVLEKLARRSEELAVLVVRHPRVTAELLRAMSTHEAWKVRQAVAQSQRATNETLQALSGDHDYDVRSAVALNALVTLGVLEMFSRDPHPLVRSAVALNERSPAALLERLATDTDSDVRQAVAVSTGSLSVLEALSNDSQDGVRRAVALNPRCSGRLLERLSADTDSEVRRAVADHPLATRACGSGIFGAEFAWQDLYQRLTTGDVLETELRFLAGLNEFALSLALSHPNCTADVLELLSTNEDWKLRQRVAQHPRAPAITLERLGTDGDYDVRTAVALHIATPRGTLLILSRDDQGAVRKAVASRTNLEPHIIETLAWDEDDEVLSALGRSSNLRELAQTKQPLEASALAQLLEIGTPLALRLCAGNPAVNSATLQALCASSDWQVRLEVARQAACNAETLEVLCSDADADVRRAVAGNPSTPTGLLTRLLRDDDKNVQRAALSNRHLPLEALLTQRKTILTRNLTLQGLNRLIALEHPELPRTEFRKIRNLHALVWLERLALTRNPRTPAAPLEVLGSDANRFVRMIAQIRLEKLGEAALESARLEVNND